MHQCPKCNRMVFRRHYAQWQKPIITILHRRPYICLNESCHWQGWLAEDPHLNPTFRL